MELLIKVGQFFLSLSILIVLHECGHFFPAKYFKTRVDKFYLFFDPWFSLVKKKIGGTEYGIGWLPLGGYVKIAGMIDESMDKEQMKKPPEPWEFRSKPAWQRLIIMLGGVTVNFILGIFIYSMIFWHSGEEYVPVENAKYGVLVDSLGMELGLKTGDKVLGIGDKKLVIADDDHTIMREIVLNKPASIKIERAGVTMDLPIIEGTAAKLATYSNKGKSLFSLPLPFIVDTMIKGKVADVSGLIKKGDRIVAFNDVPTPFYSQFQREAAKYKDADSKFTILRGADTLSVKLHSNSDGKFGLGPVGAASRSINRIYETKKIDYSFGSSIAKGCHASWDLLTNYAKSIGTMFSGKIKASENLGGFASMADMFGTTWNWLNFWELTAKLSIILGFMNLLPIPALDGGYVVFLFWEILTGKKPNDTFVEKAVTAGFFLMLSLMLYANGLDVFRRMFH
jgi:regulator of sigma E protease